jgi:hypothetical protein
MFVWGQVGGKPPLLNLHQRMIIPVMVGDVVQMRNLGTLQMSDAILQMRRRSMTPALLNTVRLLNCARLAEEIRMEATTVDIGSYGWLKRWLEKHNLQVRTPEPIESVCARLWRHWALTMCT